MPVQKAYLNQKKKQLLKFLKRLRKKIFRLKNKKTGEESTLAVDGFFEFIGLIPNNRWLKNLLPLSVEGFVITNAYGETEIPGLYIAGDLRDKDMRQIATAVGDGAMVVRVMEKYLESQSG